MPVTFWTFTVAVAAIVGLPGLAGFFSKDAILVLAYEHSPAVFAVLAFTAILTAFYMLRLWKIVFLGEPRSEAAGHAHEGGLSVTAPLVLLAVLSVAGGYTALYGRAFDGVFSLIPEAEGQTHAVILATSLIVLALGAGTALAFYRTDGNDAPRSLTRSLLLNLRRVSRYPLRESTNQLIHARARSTSLILRLGCFIARPCSTDRRPLPDGPRLRLSGAGRITSWENESSRRGFLPALRGLHSPGSSNTFRRYRRALCPARPPRCDTCR